MINDPKAIARLTCICLSSTANVVSLIYILYAIYYKKEKKLNACLKCAILYLLFGIITPLYNVGYRFVITTEWCFVSDSIEEVLVVTTRFLLLLFYLIRLKKVFEGSGLHTSKNVLLSLFGFMMAYSIIIPLLWIPQQRVTPYIIEGFGVYCSNIGDMTIIIFYYALDFIFTTLLTFIFIYKLFILHKHDDSENKTDKSLARIIKKTTISTMISIISTWIIMYPSYLDGLDFLGELRWFYPLDYGINGLCVFFMFAWECDCKYCDKQQFRNNVQMLSNISSSKSLSGDKTKHTPNSSSAGQNKTNVTVDIVIDGEIK